MIQSQLERTRVHAMRLNAEIHDLNQQTAEKTQALEEAEKRIGELEAELKQLNGQHR